MSWLANLINRGVAEGVNQAISNFAASDDFKRMIDATVFDVIDKHPDPRTWQQFVFKIGAALYRISSKKLDGGDCMARARVAYVEFKRDNRIKRFGAPGWDWTSAGAETVARAYEADFWEPSHD